MRDGSFFAPQPQPSLAGSLAWLGQFRAALEQVFSEAGDDLGQALANLGALSGQFRQLETTLGPQAEAALVGLIDEITAHLADLQDDCGAFTSVSDKLRKSVAAIAQQVRELDNVVRTIANISINARIQGNSLVPPRPQVVAFIERLAAMSQESETILAEINDAMASVGLDMGAMADGQRDLVRELTQTVFPAIEGFTRMSQEMHNSQGDIQQASAELAGQAQKIEAQVGQLIVALQIGDSTRQRLERAEDTLGQAMAQEDRGVKPLAHLALALEQGALDAAEGQLTQALDALRALGLHARSVLSGPATAAITGNAFLAQTAPHNARQRLAKSLQVNDQRFAALKTRAGAVQERLGVILRHEATLRRIAQEIRLSGVNAVIICAKLGEDGRALRELAHWLRDLTDASDAIIAHLQGILAQARDSLHQLTEARIGRLEQLLQIFAQASENLDQLLQGAAADVGKTAKEFAHSAVVLPQHLSNATDLLDGVQAQIAQRRPAQAQLEQGLALMPQPLPETLDAAPLGLVLQRLYALYTMQAERQIHSQIIDGYAQPVPDARQPAPKPARPAVPEPLPESTGETDDLEDIFF